MIKNRFRLVLTPVGVAALVIALIILIRSLTARNSYEMLLSSAVLLLLLVLGIVGSWKSKKLVLLEPGLKLPSPVVASSALASQKPWFVTGLDVQTPLFFRLHFIMRGRFFPSGSTDNGCRVLDETSVSKGEDAQLALDFPVSGVFNGRGFCRLRDVFGFYSFPCGIPWQRTVNVTSSPFFGKKAYINAQSGAEDKRNKTSSDEERYYMREYAPGDRLRDINWKSSEKIDALITRISPDNQEKVSRIEVYLRNFGIVGKTPVEALWLLDRAKSRLSHFLRNAMEENSSFIFNVRCANGEWEIENSEDLDAFVEDLSGISFALPKNESIAQAGTSGSEIYVFSTACDTGLNDFLLSNASHRPVSLFFVQPAVKDKEKKEQELSTLRKRDFLLNGIVPPPRWLVKEKIKQLSVYANRVEIISAETTL